MYNRSRRVAILLYLTFALRILMMAEPALGWGGEPWTSRRGLARRGFSLGSR